MVAKTCEVLVRIRITLGNIFFFLNESLRLAYDMQQIVYELITIALWIVQNHCKHFTYRHCQVSLQNIFDDSFTDHICSISRCANKNCKTCDILITRNYFNSNLTNQMFYTKTGEKLDLCLRN